MISNIPYYTYVRTVRTYIRTYVHTSIHTSWPIITVFFRFRLWAGWDTSSGRYWHSSDARLKDWPMLSARGLPSSLQDFMLGLVFYCSWSLHCTCSILYCSTIVPYRTILTYIILIILSCSLLIYSAKTSRAFWSRQTDLDKVSTEHWSSGCLWKVQPLRCSVGVWRTGRWRQTFSYQILSVHIQCRINPCHISAYFWIYHAIIECHCNISCNISSHFWMQALRVSPRRNMRRNLSPFARSILSLRFLCSHHGLSLGLTGLAPSLDNNMAQHYSTASFFKSNFVIFLWSDCSREVQSGFFSHRIFSK